LKAAPKEWIMTKPKAAHAAGTAKIARTPTVPPAPAKPKTGPVLDDSARANQARHERHKRHAATTALDTDQLFAEMNGDFRAAHPGKFTSVDVIAWAKAHPGSAMHTAFIVHGGATDAERVRTFERHMASVYGKPNLAGRA
jgi:hypothetical protein